MACQAPSKGAIYTYKKRGLKPCLVTFPFFVGQLPIYALLYQC